MLVQNRPGKRKFQRFPAEFFVTITRARLDHNLFCRTKATPGQPKSGTGGSVTISPRYEHIDWLEPLLFSRPAEYVRNNVTWNTGLRWLWKGLSEIGLKILKVNKGNDRDITNFHETPQGRGLIRARRVLRIGHGRISSEGPQKSEVAGDGGPHCRVADVGN